MCFVVCWSFVFCICFRSFFFWPSTLLVSEYYQYVNKNAHRIFFCFSFHIFSAYCGVHFISINLKCMMEFLYQWNWKQTITSFFWPDGACFNFSHLINGKIQFVSHLFGWSVFLMFVIRRANCSNKLHCIQHEINLILFHSRGKEKYFICFHFSPLFTSFRNSNKYGFI